MEETNQQVIADAVKEIQEAGEDKLKETISKWFEQTRTTGMKIGAKYISAAVYGTIKKHLNKQNPSLRDYKRMTEELIRIISVQVQTEQNDSEATE